MTARDRLQQVADAARDAVAGTLEALGPGLSEVAPPDVLDAGADALAGAEAPAVVAHAAAADGATGPAVLALTVAGARRLAALLGAIDEEEAEFGGGGDLGERELSAVREATAKLAAAVASAVTSIVDREAAFRPASVRVASDAEALRVGVEPGMHAAVVAFELLGEPGRLAVLVPASLTAPPPPAVPAGDPPLPGEVPLGGALRSVNVRVWAELGRTRMPTGEVVGLPSGAIVELDRDADDAVDLYVDGQRYATGRLVVTDDDSWGVRIERILAQR